MSKSDTNRNLANPFMLLGFAFVMGLLPIVLNLVVDPYQVFSERERPAAINDLAEKTHYPLWKLARYNPGSHDTVILGDSRARALRDKYWHESGVTTAINLAYGGGTIPEIYSTFQLLKDDRKIRRLIIGIQLRSFDERHKGGMDRVPEAVDLLSNPISYLKNWHVTETSVNVFKAENLQLFHSVNTLAQKLSISAQAGELGRPGQTTLNKLLEPKVCFGCDLPENLRSVPFIKTGVWSGGYHNLYLRYGNGLSVSRDLPEYYRLDLASLSNQERVALPKKFARLVKKNGGSDWRRFTVSEKYWSKLEKISQWAKLNKVELIFVIPPTIAQMQKTIASHGLAQQNHLFRLRLARFGHALDLDFPNELTREVTNFTDAYHFNSKVARAIVEQTVLQFEQSPSFKKRRFAFKLACSEGRLNSFKPIAFKHISLVTGENCRLWKEGS